MCTVQGNGLEHGGALGYVCKTTMWAEVKAGGRKPGSHELSGLGVGGEHALPLA